jgi:peroxiredoxin
MTTNPFVPPLEMAVQQARESDAPLIDRLTIVAEAIRALNPVYAEAVDRMVVRFRQASVGESGPVPGEVMPGFVLPDESGHLVSLDHMLARGPVAISFNRGHWCPFCRINVFALVEIQDQVKNMGCQIVAITPERRRFTTALKTDAKAPFPILTDMDNGYALSLNLAIWVGQEIQGLLARAGRDLPLYQGNQGWILPVPATFVIGTDGVVVARYMNPDFRLRMDIDPLLGALRAAR